MNECKWIPIAEILPEIDKIVLLLRSDGHTMFGARTEGEDDYWIWAQSYGTDFEEGKFVTDSLEQDDDYNVTHWLDLAALVPPLLDTTELATNEQQ